MWRGVGRGFVGIRDAKPRRSAEKGRWTLFPLANDADRVRAKPMGEMGQDGEGFPERLRRRPC